MYVNQKCYVKWANELSEPFTVANGVENGVVISPLLFSIYRVCQKKKDILNIHIKSEGINIFSQNFYWEESTIFVVKCQQFTLIV